MHSATVLRYFTGAATSTYRTHGAWRMAQYTEASIRMSTKLIIMLHW